VMQPFPVTNTLAYSATKNKSLKNLVKGDSGKAGDPGLPGKAGPPGKDGIDLNSKSDRCLDHLQLSLFVNETFRGIFSWAST